MMCRIISDHLTESSSPEIEGLWSFVLQAFAPIQIAARHIHIKKGEILFFACDLVVIFELLLHNFSFHPIGFQRFFIHAK